MDTPKKVTDWFAHYYAGVDAQLYALPVPQVDPLAGIIPNPDNALQGLADIKAATDGNPPTGNEPNAVEYAANYKSVIDSIEHVRRFVAAQMQGYGQ